LKLNILEKKTNFHLWYIVRRMFDQEELETIAEQVDPIGITTAKTLGGHDETYRDSIIKWLPDCDDTEFKWIYKRIWKWARIANEDNWHFDITGWQDGLQHTYYPAEGGHYSWHTDIGGDGINHRKISGTVLLKDCIDGGRLQFKCGKDNADVVLEEGDAVFFPSWYLHRVTPVKKGERESLVSWISGPPYK